MGDLSVKIPKSLEGDKELEKKIGELIALETKRRELLKLADETMKGAKHLSDKKLVVLGRKFKKNRFEELKKQGLV